MSRYAARMLPRVALVSILLLLPLPWRAAAPSLSPGTAWRLDGRLEADGRPLDPPGETFWLAAGRPQLLGERLFELLGLSPSSSPLAGPSAPPSSQDAAAAAAAAVASLTGAEAPSDLVVSFPVGPLDLGRYAGSAGLGDSHGLAVAVGLLRAEGLLDLGPVAVAATGRVTSSGEVLPVGGIRAKVRAAVRAGATLLLVPASQADLASASVPPARQGGVRVVGVGHLADLLPEG